jgi:periplasmic protein TonB
MVMDLIALRHLISKHTTMTNKEILQSDMLDILFEHRNKSYGAYALRKGYDHRLAKAMGISFSVVLIFVLLNSFKNNGSNRGGGFLNEDDSIIILTIPTDIPPKEIEKEIKPKQKVPEKMVQYTDNIKLQEDVKIPPPNTEQIDNSNISNTNTSGEPPTGIIKNTDPLPAGNGDGDVKKDPPVVVENLITRDASYPGGMESFTKFLKKNLETPGELEPGEKKKVYVRFVVDIEGIISNVQIIQSAGDQYDMEVLRVLKKMPKWVPAMQNGTKTAVNFTQAVTFVGEEE